MKRLLLYCLMCLGLAAMPAAGAEILERADVRAFIADMSGRHGFPAAELEKIFSRVTISDSIIDAMTRPAEALPWYKYRPIFVQRDRINLGVEFWRKHRTVLERASETYGVPAEIIVAIIGVETRYGRNMGRHKVIDSLTTLAFDYPARADFFRSELEQYLLLTREQGIDPLSVQGSYAGAMGIPQFISSSYRRYAVDFDGDGHIDLINNPEDAIGSVANYFHVHGWRRGERIAIAAKLNAETATAAVTSGLEPDLPVADLAGLGIEPAAPVPGGGLVKLLEFEDQWNMEYWLGLPNFYVITRYNHSALYAMAVFQLAGEIRERFYAKTADRRD